MKLEDQQNTNWTKEILMGAKRLLSLIREINDKLQNTFKFVTGYIIRPAGTTL
jgi:hypothetical protein